MASRSEAFLFMRTCNITVIWVHKHTLTMLNTLKGNRSVTLNNDTEGHKILNVIINNDSL